jgi:hypothetical protein
MIRSSYQDWKKEELIGPIPPPPDFSESIDAVRERIAKVMGKVTVPPEVRVGTLQSTVFLKRVKRDQKNNVPLHIQCRGMILDLIHLSNAVGCVS